MPAIPPGCPASRHAMKRIFTLMLATLLLGLLGCQGTPPTPTTTPPTTHTPTAATTTTATAQPPTVRPTQQPTATSSPRPTQGPTSTPTPRPTPTAISGPTWRILFRGFSCERRSPCSPFDDTQFKYYAINSDGTDLEQLQISSFPPTPTVPEDAPPLLSALFVPPPQISPDGTALLYLSDKNNLYAVDRKTGEVTLHLDFEEVITDKIRILGVACWSSDGTKIRFVMKVTQDVGNHVPTFFTIERDGSNLRELFTLPNFKFTGYWTCSPNNKEMIFSVPVSDDPENAGLYIVDLDQQDWWQVLSSYSVWQVRAVPNQP